MMASSSTLLLFLLFASLLHFSSSQTQQRLLSLTHTHSYTLTPTPTHHLLRSSSLRSAARFHSHRHRNQHNKQATQQKQLEVSLPLAAGSDYTLTLTLSPTTSVELYMDTGSDLVWFPCSPFRCILCEGKTQFPPPPPPPPPLNSTLIPCFDPACSAAHSAAPTSDLCSIASCPLEDIETSSCRPSSHPCPNFYYAYGDGSLVGRLRRGPIALNSLTIPNFTFACAHSALAEPVGVAGFGRGELSLPNQLLVSRFSYCLVSHSFARDRLLRPSPLILGRALAPLSPKFTYTPILHNPKFPYFYSVALLAVSVGDRRIEAGRSLRAVDAKGNGGMVVDSGTTFTMLPTGLYREIVAEFGRRMEGSGFVRAEEVEAETGMGVCHYCEGRNDSRAVPAVAMEFGGGARVEMPRGNYFLGFERGGRRVGCLMVMDAGEEEAGGPAGTLGNFQQQGFEVVYDLEEGRVGFARRRCAALWDQMSRG